MLDLDETKRLVRQYHRFDTIGQIGLDSLAELVAEVERLRALLGPVDALATARARAIALQRETHEAARANSGRDYHAVRRACDAAWDAEEAAADALGRFLDARG